MYVRRLELPAFVACARARGDVRVEHGWANTKVQCYELSPAVDLIGVQSSLHWWFYINPRPLRLSEALELWQSLAELEVVFWASSGLHSSPAQRQVSLTLGDRPGPYSRPWHLELYVGHSDWEAEERWALFDAALSAARLGGALMPHFRDGLLHSAEAAPGAEDRLRSEIVANDGDRRTHRRPHEDAARLLDAGYALYSTGGSGSYGMSRLRLHFPSSEEHFPPRESVIPAVAAALDIADPWLGTVSGQGTEAYEAARAVLAPTGLGPWEVNGWSTRYGLSNIEEAMAETVRFEMEAFTLQRPEGKLRADLFYTAAEGLLSDGEEALRMMFTWTDADRQFDDHLAIVSLIHDLVGGPEKIDCSQD